MQGGRLGGALDGAIERGLMFTVPVSAGFRAGEAVHNVGVAEHPGWEWFFGNVYDPKDGVTPLDWWVWTPTNRCKGSVVIAGHATSESTGTLLVQVASFLTGGLQTTTPHRPAFDGNDRATPMAEFKIAAAQIASVRGDIHGNIAVHAAAIEAAAKQGVSVLVFPELSLTGYEPELAADLAITASDSRLIPLLNLARHHQMEVIVGAPLLNGTMRPNLGAIVFTSNGVARTYAKIHLGSSERTYFAPGSAPLTIAVHGKTIGIAICADASQPSHAQAYADAGSTIYAASVFLNAEWYATDAPRLASYAGRCQMLVVMANHAASVGAYGSVGRSAVWAPGGPLLAEAQGVENCLVTATGNRESWRGEVVRI